MLWRSRKDCWFARPLSSAALDGLEEAIADGVRTGASELIGPTLALMSLPVTLKDSHCQLPRPHFELEKCYHGRHDECFTQAYKRALAT